MRGFLHTLLGKCDHAGKVKLLRGFRLRDSNVAGELAGRKPDRNGDVPQRYERSHSAGFRWFVGLCSFGICKKKPRICRAFLVGARGFEPPTPSLPDANLRTFAEHSETC